VTLRIGIIGAGIMGRGHAEVLAAHPDATVTAVASRTLAHAQELADSVGTATAFADYRDLIASGRVDAVSITTPDDLHAEVMIEAAKAGLHILVEKPFTTDIAGADQAANAIADAGVIAMCLFNHRWVPAYAQAKDCMAEVGTPVVAYTRKDDTIFVPTEMINWAQNTTCAWFLSSHDIDLITWLFDDRIVEVYASARYGLLRSKGIDTPDAIQIQATFCRGAIATFESAWIYPNTFPTVVDSYVTVIGEAGAIQLDRQKENIQLATHDKYAYPRNNLQRVVHGIPAGAYRDAIHHFIACATTGAQPLITVESSRHVTAVLAAAHQSIVSGRPEPVPGPSGRA
jgi:predicted dehydrogenase